MHRASYGKAALCERLFRLLWSFFAARVGVILYLKDRGLLLSGIGIALGREDLHPRLPSWRRYEYREALKAYATKHGQPITNAQADHDIDKAVALGELDAHGPVLHVEGTREELVAAVMQTGERFGIPMDRAEAERLTDKAIRRRFPWPAIVLAALLLAIIVALVV